MAGEFRELVDEVRQALHAWLARRRGGEPVVELHSSPDGEVGEILFSPLDPSVAMREDWEVTETSQMSASCPVTRQTVDLRRGCYVCRACGVAYSREGWEFLRDEDKGRCCVCSCQNSVSFRAHVRRSSDPPVP